MADQMHHFEKTEIRTNNLFFFKSHHNRIRKKRFLILLHYVFPELLWKKDPTCDFYNQSTEYSKSVPNFCSLNTCTRESYLLKQH